MQSVPEDRAPAGVRRAALAVFAAARADELSAIFEVLPEVPAFVVVRAPEPGLVMARGRIGGGGPPFNVGEVSVTRAVVRIEGGAVGFGHVLGRDTDRALAVAKLDA